MKTTRIMLEPGRNYKSKHSVRNNEGNTFEYEFYHDIVYKVSRLFQDTNIEIADPSWAAKHPSVNERVDYLNEQTDNYDIFIGLRFSDKDTLRIYSQRNEVSEGYKDKIETASALMGIGDNRHKILYATRKPGIIMELASVNDTSEYLQAQNTRRVIAHDIAQHICSIIDPSISTIVNMNQHLICQESDMTGVLLVNNLPIRRSPATFSDILCDGNKDLKLEIVGFYDKDWCEVVYGENCAYVDRNLIKIIDYQGLSNYVDMWEFNVVSKTACTTGVVKSLATKLVNTETGKVEGVLFKGTQVRIVGTTPGGHNYIIHGRFASHLLTTPTKNIQIIGESIDNDTKRIPITMDELERLGYTHILI